MTTSPRAAPPGSPGRALGIGASSSAALLSAFPVVATKTLPVREDASVDPDKVCLRLSPRLSELHQEETRVPLIAANCH